ncbi:MAG: hypothetical protein IIX93_00850 [Clostridia bacterium]|nr:hypothetical protein [Clostridia bacterium]
MYTEKDFLHANKQKKIRVTLFAFMAAAFLALMFVFNTMRIQPLSIFTAVAGFMVSYFIWSFKVSPWVKYDKHLKEVRTGQKRETACEIMYFTDETRLVDGVEVHELVARVGKEEEDERLYYWDADKKRPDLKEGDKVSIVSYGNFVVELKNA